jgi:hypothetical protein
MNYFSDIAVDSSGNLYISGHSGASWGTPVRPYSVYTDAIVVKLDTNGALAWTSFFGGRYDFGYGIGLDGSGNIYLAGLSTETWGEPVRPLTPSGNIFGDAVVVKIPAVTRCAEEPDIPFLISPIDDKVQSRTKAKLNWSDTACADTAQVIVRQGSKKGPRVLNQDGLTESKAHVSDLISGETYFWRVVAKNSFGKSKSAWFEFSVK